MPKICNHPICPCGTGKPHCTYGHYFEDGPTDHWKSIAGYPQTKEYESINTLIDIRNLLIDILRKLENG